MSERVFDLITGLVNQSIINGGEISIEKSSMIKITIEIEWVQLIV